MAEISKRGLCQIINILSLSQTGFYSDTHPNMVQRLLQPLLPIQSPITMTYNLFQTLKIAQQHEQRKLVTFVNGV